MSPESSSSPHLPVLLDGVLDQFKDMQLRSFVDGTLGAGGHASALLAAHLELDCYLGIDQDPSARELAKGRLASFESRVRIAAGNAEHMDAIARASGVDSCDGILVDLGVSSMQMDQGERGFSIQRDGPLDMRMDPTRSLTAQEIVNEWSEEDLRRLFFTWGEEPRSRRAAAALVRERKNRPITTTHELVQVLCSALPKIPGERIHPCTRIFQALRIQVNDELGVLERMLPRALDLLKPGGRLAIISFHSLEDRMVKQFFQKISSDKESTSGLGGLFIDKQPLARIITRKPVVASDAEREYNPRARSAKLRVVERL